jgi:hypothetical protein
LEIPHDSPQRKTYSHYRRHLGHRPGDAKQFLAEGARVIVTGGTIEKAKAGLGSEVLTLRADSASVAEQKKLTEAVN